MMIINVNRQSLLAKHRRVHGGGRTEIKYSRRPVGLGRARAGIALAVDERRLVANNQAVVGLAVGAFDALVTKVRPGATIRYSPSVPTDRRSSTRALIAVRGTYPAPEGSACSLPLTFLMHLFKSSLEHSDCPKIFLQFAVSVLPLTLIDLASQESAKFAAEAPEAPRPSTRADKVGFISVVIICIKTCGNEGGQ